MPTTIEEETVIPKNAVTFIDMNVTRVSEGIQLKIKSKEIEAFFALSGIDEEESAHLGYKPYHIPNLPNSSFRNLLSYWGSHDLLLGSESSPNLSILRSIGLSEGIKVVYPIVLPSSDIQQYVKNLTSEITKFYKEFIKPVDLSVKILTVRKGEEIEV